MAETDRSGPPGGDVKIPCIGKRVMWPRCDSYRPDCPFGEARPGPKDTPFRAPPNGGNLFFALNRAKNIRIQLRFGPNGLAAAPGCKVWGGFCVRHTAPWKGRGRRQRRRSPLAPEPESRPVTVSKRRTTFVTRFFLGFKVQPIVANRRLFSTAQENAE